VTVHGEFTNPPEIDAGLAAAALAVFAHRHEVVHLLYAATDEPDALARIGALLRVDEATIARVLNQPLRWMLPHFRTELETLAAAPGTAGAAGLPTPPASTAGPRTSATPVAPTGPAASVVPVGPVVPTSPTPSPSAT
jgi:hypothetical protein